MYRQRIKAQSYPSDYDQFLLENNHNLSTDDNIKILTKLSRIPGSEVLFSKQQSQIIQFGGNASIADGLMVGFGASLLAGRISVESQYKSRVLNFSYRQNFRTLLARNFIPFVLYGMVQFSGQQYSNQINLMAQNNFIFDDNEKGIDLKQMQFKIFYENAIQQLVLSSQQIQTNEPQNKIINSNFNNNNNNNNNNNSYSHQDSEQSQVDNYSMSFGDK